MPLSIFRKLNTEKCSRTLVLVSCGCLSLSKFLVHCKFFPSHPPSVYLVTGCINSSGKFLTWSLCSAKRRCESKDTKFIVAKKMNRIAM
jgi:hypothetical protein